MKNKTVLFLLLISLSPFLLQTTSAQMLLPAFFSDNMVLQQQSEPAIWGWTKPGSTVFVNTSWNKKRYNAVADEKGKWKIKLSTTSAGGPYEINISDGKTITLHNILLGEVWLCSGQSNMEMPMKGFRDQPVLGSNDAIFHAANDHIRLFTVPRSVQRQPLDTPKNSSWKAAGPEVVANFSATGYFFGRYLYESLQVPVGLVNISYGGSPVEAFMSREALGAYPEIKIPLATDTVKLNNKVATVLYNGMLHNFLGYGIKGCIWYQGESNYDRPDQYENLFADFVKEIRSASGLGNFAFYFAQVAPYTYTNNTAANIQTPLKNNSAFLRDAQRKALAKIPNSGMAVLMDIGEEFSIHPMNKEVGSKRMAMMALGQTYGQKGFAFASPAFDSISFSGNTATIKFTNAPNGLTAYGKPLTSFEIAGADKIFRPAKAVIWQGKVLVSSLDVKEPVAVRYAFKDFVMGELFSTEGFPVSSFRTDNW